LSNAITLAKEHLRRSLLVFVYIEEEIYHNKDSVFGLLGSPPGFSLQHIKLRKKTFCGSLLSSFLSLSRHEHTRTVFSIMSFRKSAVYLAATTTTTGTTAGAGAIAVVTGAKSGIGAALRQKIAAWDCVDTVVAVSRSISINDLALDGIDNQKCIPLAADIATTEGRRTIVNKVHELCTGGDGASTATTPPSPPRHKQLRFLIHCAGTIDPIKSILELQPQEFEKSWQVNVEGPLFLTTALHPYLQPIAKEAKDSGSDSGDDSGIAGRVLHVSSGAAHGAPPVGWGTYGITKAAFFQSFRVLERELRDTGVVVGSFKPGVVDTAMQGVIRSTPSTVMPVVQNFISLKTKADQTNNTNTAATEEQAQLQQVYARPPPKGALDTPTNVAFFAEFLLLGTTDEEFANAQADGEWDIRDSSHFERWILPEHLPKEE
jgi:NAD(P)-dependent dehydrogenase (short-subunit alcohol dehydrogenase family)